jgi:hypothetical protein
MMTGPVSQFEARLKQRGYTWAEVEPCVVSRDGDQITVDETHPAYPHAREGDVTQPAMEGGPGTVLKGWLGWFGITATNECSCNSRAAKMDDLGSEWVRQNLDIVIGWLEEEARTRGGITWLAFSRTAARMLVLRACDSADARSGVVGT